MDIMHYYVLVGFVKTAQSAPPVEQMLNHCDSQSGLWTVREIIVLILTMIRECALQTLVMKIVGISFINILLKLFL